MKNLEELNKWFCDNFEESDGPPKAYFYLLGERYVYDYVALAVRGGTEVHEELFTRAGVMFKSWLLESALNGIVPHLFWRRRPELNITRELDLGELWMTHEQWIDAGKPELPAGHGYSFDSMNIYKIKGEYEVSSLCCRFVTVPYLGVKQLEIKPQGAPIKIIKTSAC